MSLFCVAKLLPQLINEENDQVIVFIQVFCFFGKLRLIYDIINKTLVYRSCQIIR